MPEAGQQTDFVRICPGCGARHAPSVLRCTCGTLLAGVDLVRETTLQATIGTETGRPEKPLPPDTDLLICPHEDCAQPNPAGSRVCQYCNRPLHLHNESPEPVLFSLPEALAGRYRILGQLPARGSEAELLQVESLADSTQAVIKLYRTGIRPKGEVLERLQQVDPCCRVRILESGLSGAHAWEVLEYCAHGSLRNYMQEPAMVPARLAEIIRELAQALSLIHAQGIVHRDLKPENILVRTLLPLDLVLTDFGIASVMDCTQCFTGMARTLMYAAPESLSGVIDAKADYWALGMILLEAVRGAHPFAGLSDAVILHHLSTRPVELADLRDGNLRKLLRGLLLRDPRRRWGENELARWLAHDSTLPEPSESRSGRADAHPYHLGPDICDTPEQLGVALSRHWQAGITDLLNGQLLAWFRDQQHDQNTGRLIIEGQHELKLSPNRQLLRLILHLAPGIPAVWRGESVEPRAILGQAAKALKGDMLATQWLMEIYQDRVLDEYSKAGNPDLADLRQRWIGACDAFARRWRERMEEFRNMQKEHGAQAPRYVDDALYDTEPLQPALGVLLPRMLALIYDRRWGSRLRTRLAGEILELAIRSPWLGRLGDPLQMDDTDLLVLEGILPDARKAHERFLQNERLQREALAGQREEMIRASTEILGRLRRHADHILFTPPVREALAADIDTLDEIIAQVRAQGHADADWQALRNRLGRTLPFLRRLQELVMRRSEQQPLTDALLNMQNLPVLVIAFALGPIFLGPNSLYIILVIVLLLALWQLLPLWLDMRRVRKLLDNI